MNLDVALQVRIVIFAIASYREISKRRSIVSAQFLKEKNGEWFYTSYLLGGVS